MCAAFTPLTTGPDAAEVAVPYDPADGVTSIAWTLRWVGLRVQTAGGAPAVTRPIRALTIWIATIRGKVSSRVHRRLKPNCAPPWL